MAVYDDQKDKTHSSSQADIDTRFADIARREEIKDLESQFNAPGFSDERNFKNPSPSDLKATEARPDSIPSGAPEQGDQLGRGYNPDPQGGGGSNPVSRFGSTIRGMWKGASWRKKATIVSAGGGILVGLATGAIGLFGLLNVFQLDHLLSNIERKGFIRYQVDMEGRSNKWITAYLMLRMGEVDDRRLKPADRDNVIFRANRVSTGNPLTDWYKTMRASSFEADLLEKHNVKFASAAYREGNMIKFRPALVTIGDKEFNFTPTKAEMDAWEKGDINGFNNKLRDFVEVKIFENDKEARRWVRNAVKSETKFYQVVKRYYLRKSIQNMTGIRDWRFFEKTRDKAHEKKISIRNKIIAKSFPESTKSGKFIQCMFGITECKTTTDPANPENRSSLAPLGESCSNSPSNPSCNTGHVDENGKPIHNDGSAANGLSEGVGDGGDPSKSLTKKMLSQLISKFSGVTSVISFIDTLNNVDKNIKSGSLSAMVYMARAAQDIGLFTTFNIMRDQLRTGEATSEEVGEVMEVISNAGNSEAWQTLVASGDINTASAAGTEYTPTEEKEVYCKPENQELMVLPENAKKAQEQVHFICDHEKIGGENLAKDIENGWNKSIGAILSPILAVYNGSGLGKIVSWINGAIDAILGPIIQGTMQAVLKALGLEDDFKNLMAWLMAKAASILGAGPTISEDAPSGVITNHISMGAAASSEFAMRASGAAVTTKESAALSRQNVLAYQQVEYASLGIYDKYFSLSNPTSLTSSSLFAVTNQSFNQTLRATFAHIMNLPSILLANKTHAATPADDPYAAAKLAGLETYDFPATCMNQDPMSMTPQSSTNADELGLIPSGELTWDLVTNHDAFFERLYADEPDDSKVKKVYNCALLDAAVRGGLGAMYDSKTLGSNAYGAGHNIPQDATGDAGNIPTGTTQELAKRILNHPNISFQVEPRQSEAMEYIAKTGRGRECGAPAVSSTLLGVLLAAAEKYKIVIGVLVDGHACNNGFHPKGMAVDINGVNPLPSSSAAGTGNRIEWTAAEQPILRQFYNDVGPLLNQVGGGGLGQIQCFSGSKPAPAPNVSYFNDTCHHIHLDVGKR